MLRSSTAQYTQLSSERGEMEAKKSALDFELRENLRLRLDQLNSVDVDAGASRDGGGGPRLKEKQKDLKRVSNAVESVTAKLGENESEIESTNQYNIDTQRGLFSQRKRMSMI